ncbi:recombinase family protein [Enterocloster clostridioformis]|uniref:recombinase family protein n=1 Tax=Enterocloster clostridioformis TaxID=1531 RepID=UPI00267614A6|nr:recombinase family protein [Enterocloster clostridioformis]
MLRQQTKLPVRLYARLSKDDGDANKESNSITNQLQMLRYHAKEKGFEVIGEYVDDGISGTTFDRPDLNRMIKDAMDDTRPTGIMVKDMSRFGCNNAMFMYYVEEIFPNNDILFIALNDDVDTRFDENEMMPFKSIMKEYYARDTSKKKSMEALGDQSIKEMHELSEKGGGQKIKQFRKDLEIAEKRIAEIDNVIMKLFEQNALGKISDERFEKMSSAYENEQKELTHKRDDLKARIRAEEKKTQSTN